MSSKLIGFQTVRFGLILIYIINSVFIQAQYVQILSYHRKKNCLRFPFNRLDVTPLLSSGSVLLMQLFATTSMHTIHCSLATQILFRSVSKLDIALVFSRVFERQLWAHSAARCVSLEFLPPTSSTWCLRISPGDRRRELPSCSSTVPSHKRCSCRGRRLHDRTHH